MPTFIAAIGGVLINLVGTLVGRVLVALGLSVVTYTGMSTTLDWLKAQAVQAFSGAPVEVVGMLSMMKVGVAISIVCSAIVAKAVLNGIGSDGFKKWVLK